MLEGLTETECDLNQYGIELDLISGDPAGVIPEYINSDNSAGTLVTDFSPLREKKQWMKTISERINIPIIEVDAHNIVPVWTASPKQEAKKRKKSAREIIT